MLYFHEKLLNKYINGYNNLDITFWKYISNLITDEKGFSFMGTHILHAGIGEGWTRV